jgi:predicted PurR-regulated permease PerM
MRTIDISHKTIFFVAAFLGILWALYQIREVIVILFIAIIFMSALYPVVGFLDRFKVPRALSIAVTYILIIAIIIGLLTLVISPLIDQTSNLVTHLPTTVNDFFPSNVFVNQSIIQEQINSVSQNAVNLSLTLFNNIIAFISVVVLTFYLLLERDKLDGLIAQFFIGHEQRVIRTTHRIEDKLGSWLRGQLALSLIIGVMVYITLLLLGIPFALPLAILAGLLEVVPVIGPIISSIPSIIVALTISPIQGLFVGVAFFIIQQLENNLIVPQVMKKAVGLNPLIVILAVAIGGKLLGIAGALLAVPIAVVIQILTEDYIQEKE